MTLWFRCYSELVDDPKAQRLPAAVFRKRFLAAVKGEKNEFSAFVRPCSGRPSAWEWDALRRTVYARDDYTCAYCGERGRKLECDHVIPVSRGGSNDLDNLVTACRPCNRSKRDKTPAEWRQ